MASSGMIVLAEDDPKLRKLYTAVFTTAGYQVMSAGDGVEVIKLLGRVTPKLVLLDVMMPRLSGIDACKRVRGMVGDDVPILFLSALDQLHVVRDCIAVGADDYLIKTGSILDLVDRIKRWTSRSGRGVLAERRKQLLADFTGTVDN